MLSMANENLNALRALTKKRQRAVGNKISRLKQEKNVSVSGGEFDPRRDSSSIDKLNSRQLNSYLNQLNGFMDRKTQFVPNYRKQPIEKSKWDRYKAMETKFNEKLTAHYEQYKDIVINPSNKKNAGPQTTVDERHKRVKPMFPHMVDAAVSSPWEQSDRKSTQIVNMDKLTADMKDKVRPGYFKRELRKAREQFTQMVEVVADADLVNMFNELSDKQVDLLWNHTSFATSVSLAYLQAQKRISKKELAATKETLDSQLRQARKLVKWAKTVDFSS